MLVSISTSVATWCFLIGGFVGYYLNAKMGLATLIAGSMIGMFILSLAIVLPSAKYGLESVTTSKAFFGNRGWYIALALQYLSVIGWNSILLIFFGKATTQLLVGTGMLAETASTVSVSVCSIVAVAVIWWLLRRGAPAVAKVSSVIAVLVIVVGIWMFYMILSNFGLSAITSAVPAYAAESRLWNFTTGIEIGIISLIAWWPYIGGIVRVVPKTKDTTLPSMLGLGLPVAIMSIIGLLSILVIGDPDPTMWMLELGGIGYGSVALAFIALANFGSAMIGVYISTVGLRNLPIMAKQRWNVSTIIALIPVAFVAVVIPELFFSGFGNFLTILGVLFAPLLGIQIVDYHFFRNKTLDVRALYDSSSSSIYAFWKGWNPVSIISMALGFITYLYLLDPLTYESHSPYQYMTATIPTMFVGGVSYWVLTKAVVIPLGKGGYRHHSKESGLKNSVKAVK